MEKVTKPWQQLIDAMLKASDKTSNADMEMFNLTAKKVNDAVTWFNCYHEAKNKGKK